MTGTGWWSRAGVVAGLCVVGVLAGSAWADPFFKIQTVTDWYNALGGDPPHVYPLSQWEGYDYLTQWEMYLEEGAPYPPTVFVPAALYVWEGVPVPPYPEDSGLVMVWATGDMAPGEYASAWGYDYLVDPDLSNAIISTSIFAPQFGPNGQINQVSFGIKDNMGRIRSWYWNVGGPLGPIPWNLLTPVTIDTSQTGLNATNPPATGYMNTPGFDITRAQFFVADENAQWIGPDLPVPPPGAPHDGLWNLWHDIIVQPRANLKWSQPPDPAYPDNVYYGWNEYSEWWYGPIVADDWLCTTPEPVTDIHWWGSFLGWKDPFLPPVLPDHFHIQFWTDVPSNPDDPNSFSHPGFVIHEVYCYNFRTEFVGWDFDPRIGEYEACFRFDQDLLPHEWFYQDAGANNIYWISIAACYGGTQVPHPWGWKTRPRDPASPAPDDAVIIWDPVQPVLGSPFVAGWPITWPTPEQSWDMAFELTTGGPMYKWEQPPDLTPEGVDVNATSPFILADDFFCSQDGPITTIRIWGSWRFDQEAPATFVLSIHDDIPAGQAAPWSMPGNTLWLRRFPPGTYQYYPFSTGIPEGFFTPPFEYIFPADTICWLYEFTIPAGEAFYQTAGKVYWLDVQVLPQADLTFGWKTSPWHWNDDAVWALGQEPMPVPGPWQELRYPPGHPFYPQSIDLAFQIEGEGPQAIKWSQPPVRYTPPDAYNGWDQYSMYRYQIAADDWRCTTPDPVTDIHWWGSFIGWTHPSPPPQGMPAAFHIAIWTDVPADPADPGSFSHPGTVIWENLCTTYSWEFVGWDFDPREIGTLLQRPPEATFKFTQLLDEWQWFWQEAGDNVYWVSIAAIYDAGQIVEYPWGWKTRPRSADSPAPDDAVWISDPAAPFVGAQYVSGGPLWYPTPAESWDLAFELTTQPPQPPRDLVVCEPQMPPLMHPPTYWYDVTPGGAFGRCDFHVRVFDPDPAHYTNVVAPPTWLFAVHQLPNGEWWASWWDPDCDNPIWPGVTFRFQYDNRHPSVWSAWTTTISSTDDPYNQIVDQSANHVGEPDGFGYRVHAPVLNTYPKWAQPPTENPQYPGLFWGWNEPSWYFGPQVVADDWPCRDWRAISDIHWWGSYLNWVEPFPPPGAPQVFHLGLWTDVPANDPTNPFPWSHPGVLIREWFVERAALDERPVGMDYHPAWGRETCFKYDFYIPRDQWFRQPDRDRVFWLSIAAIYWDVLPQHPWGWKTRQPTWNDDAVRIFAPLPPILGQAFEQGAPIVDDTGTSWDMAFVLTAPGCVGDANCDGKIDFYDIDPFVAVLSGGTPCNFYNVDMDGDGDVDFFDIDPFVAILSSGVGCP